MPWPESCGYCGDIDLYSCFVMEAFFPTIHDKLLAQDLCLITLALPICSLFKKKTQQKLFLDLPAPFLYLQACPNEHKENAPICIAPIY